MGNEKQNKLESILNQSMSILALDFTKAEDRKTALECLMQKPSLITLLSENDQYQLAVMVAAIKKNYSIILYINDHIPGKELLEAFLIGRIKEINETNKISDFSVMRSFDKRLIFNLDYVTCEGEQISYFDSELKIPNRLRVAANIKFKLNDTYKLFEYMDLGLDYINNVAIYNCLSQMVTRAFRAELYEMMGIDGTGYYSISGKFEQITASVKSRLAIICADAGLTVNELSLKNIDIPDNTGDLLENEFFALAKSERKQIRDQKVNELALSNYEKKAAIHHKYPEFPITLTEAEKDKAFERHLLKSGIKIDSGDEREKEKLKVRKDKATVNPIKVTKDVQIVTKKSKIRTVYFAVTVIGVIAAALSFIGSRIAGFVLLGITALYAGIVGSIFYPKIKVSNKKIEKSNEAVVTSVNTMVENLENDNNGNA